MPALACLVVVLGASEARAQPSEAVVLVSGLNSPTPFSAPTPACAGKEGDTWGFVAPRLKAQGFTVYTAPARKGSTGIAPCGGNPPDSAYVDAAGDLDANGRALDAFLAYLKTTFGVANARIVAHSFGGLWSRSAITQSAPAASQAQIQSLTTLGSPHTGAFSADVAEGIASYDCSALPTRDELLACLAFKVAAQVEVDQLGPVAVSELTRSYVGQWNPDQRIGGCTVTPVAGTFVSFGSIVDAIVGAYTLPADGLVGRGSASAKVAPTGYEPPSIPGLAAVTTFPVVHSSTLGFLSAKNLLNQPTIVARVASALGQPVTSACAAPTVARTSAERSFAEIVPLRAVELPSRRGRLPASAAGDLILTRGGARISCEGKRLRGRTLLAAPESATAEAIVTPKCAKPLAVSGGGTALGYRSDRRRSVALKFSGRNLTLRVRGRKAGDRLEAEFRDLKRWRKLTISSSGRAVLPSSTRDAVGVRLKLTDKRGEPVIGHTVVRRR